MFPNKHIIYNLINLPFLPSVTKLKVINEWSRVLLGSIQNLPNLEHLYFIGDEELTSFPDEMFGGLKYLKQLHIDRLLKIEVLPTGLSNLKALQELAIMECSNLETITEEVLQGLCSLKRFKIRAPPKSKYLQVFDTSVALEDLTIIRC
ncbi:hypothetical protein K1719_019913 [Acacia pycnantha]|nr:hypothetical protein K1719_019913 [Acacia pycnantha]